MDKPNQDKANTASTASKLTVRNVGKLCKVLMPAILTITAHPPNISTHIINGAVNVMRISENAAHSISTATEFGWPKTLLKIVNCEARLSNTLFMLIGPSLLLY